MMSEPSELNFNPYTPIGASGNQPLPTMPPNARIVGSVSVCLTSLAACTAAGALFGLAAAVLIMLFSLISGAAWGDFDTGGTFFMGLAGLAFLALYGVIGGGILAFFSSIPSILLVLIAGMATQQVGRRWTQRSIRRFATYSGLLAGFLPITILSQFDPSATLFSVIPALFGGFVARLLVSPLARRAGNDAEPLPSQPAGNYPAGDPLSIQPDQHNPT